MSGFWPGDQGTGDANIFGKVTLSFTLSLTQGTSYSRVTQTLGHALGQHASTCYVTEFSATALTDPAQTAHARAGLISVSCLIPVNPRVLHTIYPKPPQFPSRDNLIGLTYNSFKRPVENQGIHQALSGREVRVQYYDAIIWEWDLTYSYLPDRSPLHVGTTESDLATLIGFFQETRGGQLPFTYFDPDDNTAVQTLVAVTDGIQNVFIITRQYGGQWKEVEPVGWIPFGPVSPYVPIIPYPPDYPKVYLNGAPVDPMTFELVLNELGKQLIRFHKPPAAGQNLTMSFNYLFFVRFADLLYEFENFVHQVWDTKKITLQSMRSYVRY